MHKIDFTKLAAPNWCEIAQRAERNRADDMMRIDLLSAQVSQYQRLLAAIADKAPDLIPDDLVLKEGGEDNDVLNTNPMVGQAEGNSATTDGDAG